MSDDVSDEPYYVTSATYAVGRLERALDRAAALGATADGERVREKVRRWYDVVSGMATGRISVGTRAPVENTPAWVTLEVAHGGFATGRCLAEAPLTEQEAAVETALPGDVPGESARERLNLWYLGDEGQAELREALSSGRYRVDVPEEAALAVVVVLLDNGFAQRALDLVTELRPFMHRLRMTPWFEPPERLSGTTVRLAPAGEVAESLRTVRVPPRIVEMRRTLSVWNPLYDRLVTLWCATLDGEPPCLDEFGVVRGGWPGVNVRPDWMRERRQWLADYEQACRRYEPSGRHAHPKSNFARLRRALQNCVDGPQALSARELGWVRRALANTITRHGTPGSARREELRASQETVAHAATHADLARVIAGRLERYPAESGVPDLAPIVAAVSEHDTAAAGAPDGTPIPTSLLRKASRALEAPVDELVRRGVITSSEVLAGVLPQLTSHRVAEDIDNAVTAGLYERSYAAFRGRRSVLLLNLERQVEFDELPWVAALAPFRNPEAGSVESARRSLRQAFMVAFTAFPQSVLPNPLLRELGELASRAGMRLPLVQEVAADIFMGTFTTTWRHAAAVASRAMAGTLYAAYYDLPPVSHWDTPRRSILRWGRETAGDFTELCAHRAADEAGDSGNGIARNGALLEQSQILTTQNLAVLIDGSGLEDELGEHAPRLAQRTFDWVIHRLRQRPPDRHSALIQVKNAAYAWRQAIFLLSFCEPECQLSQLARLREESRAARLDGAFGPAIEGLAHVLDGGRFTAAGTVPGGSGRRFLGWAAGRHWYLADGV